MSTPATLSVQSVFNATAPSYDAARRALIPCFEPFYATAASLVPTDAEHILDLGAGTGLLSTFVRAHLPHARLHLIDTAEAMLAQARQHFAHDHRIVCQAGDYTTCDLGASYDAIVSALSIHHLPHPAKQALFSRIFTSLKPGGIFINADQVLGPTPALERQYRQRWLNDVRAAGATEQQIADSLLRQQEDRCAPVQDQLHWLEQAGFADPDCWFKHTCFAVLAARRPLL